MRNIPSHYDHSSAIITNRTWQEGKYTSNLQYHHFIRFYRRHPHFITFLRIQPLFLHITPRKTYFVPELIHKLSTLYLTNLVAMGGDFIHKEPATTALLKHYPAAYQIFEQAGWLNYFRRLQGYNESQVLQFARNLQENHYVIAGIQISMTEQAIS